MLAMAFSAGGWTMVGKGTSPDRCTVEHGHGHADGERKTKPNLFTNVCVDGG